MYPVEITPEYGERGIYLAGYNASVTHRYGADGRMIDLFSLLPELQSEKRWKS